MPSKVDQGAIIILDIGRNVANQDEKGPSFFENARECTTKVIERKIMSQGQDYIGIILLGSKTTKNNLADDCPGVFKNIEVLAELQTPTWQMIKDLPTQASKRRGDWFESLIVAADIFKNGTPDVKIMNKKIILITNFQSPAYLNNEVERAINGFKEDNIEVDIIGPNIYDGQKGDDIELARQFVEATNGATAPFDYTKTYLLFHKKKATRAIPWNVDLSIGPNLKIPVSAYIRLKDEPIIKNWKKAVRNPVTSDASTSEGVVKDTVYVDTENKTVTDHDNVIKGYQYGQQVIPFTDCDKSMLYTSGDKCLSVYGFTEAKNLQWNNLNGEGLTYVFGRKGDIKAEAAVQCMVHCLHEMKLVGIVRRVYNNGNAPKMFALMPVLDPNNYICLSLAGITFKNEIKCMAFPSTNLKKYACREEQVDAFKDIIRAMDLTKAYDESYDDMEAFPIAQTVSPMVQYMMDCIAYRAMNPDKPLPQPREEIMMLFKIPPLIEKRSREPLHKLKSLFTLNEIEVKKRNKRKIRQYADPDMIKNNDDLGEAEQNENGLTDDTIPKIELPSKKYKREKIGTIDPISDYKTLAETGKPLAKLTTEMIEVIENIMYLNLDGNYEKAIQTMAFFREECVKNNPEPYNKWLVTFKSSLLDRKKTEAIDLIVQKKLNFIIKDENDLSKYNTAEDTQNESQLYENDTIPNTFELTIQSDVRDMFDEM